MAQSDEERRRLTVSMPAEMVARIEEQLEYGDSRAGWIRQAIHERMREDGLLDGDGDGEQPAEN